MLKIFYTLKENMDDFNNAIDETLVESIEGTLDDEQKLGADYVVISRWNLDEYTTIMENNIKNNKSTLNIIVTNYINDIAKSLKYDSIESISKYLGFENKFQDECLKLAKFNALCWEKAIEIENTITHNSNIVPEEIIELMPKF